MSLEVAPEIPPRDQRIIAGQSPFSGLTVLNLSPAVTEELSLPAESAKGVIVSNVASGSLADRIGFEKGDILVSVNDTPIDSTRKLDEVAGGAPRVWDLAVKRGGSVLRRRLPG